MLLSHPNLLNGTPWNNRRVGLLGGSFNPAHEGHIHISLVALKMLRLDAIWWLVTPQNPLKSAQGLAPYKQRLDYCQQIVQHPRILVTNLEEQISSRYTYETICTLGAHFPLTDFVYITGMDNALSFHKWHKWKDMLSMIPTAHIARPPAHNLIRNCPLRALNTQKHITLHHAKKLKLEPHTTFWIKERKMLRISSTEIRKSR